MKILILLFFLLSARILSAGASPDSLIKEANLSYQAGEQASTFQERKNSFNKALTLYLQVEKQSEAASMPLYQALADTFFQLEEYAWSILYYERARQLDPKNAVINSHLALAREKLGLTADSEKPALFEALLLQPYLSISDCLALFFWLALLTLGIGTAAIWMPFSFLKKLAYLTGGAALVFLIHLFIFFYMTPIQGILISSTGLYRAPDFQEPQLMDLPFLAGTKMKVIKAVEQGLWLKVVDSSGQIGFIPASTIRLI